MKRLIVMTAALVVIALGGFFWCERMGWLSEAAIHAWVSRAGWPGAVTGVALLAGDIFLPTPSSLVMILNGVAFGPWGGTALSAVGSLGAAAIGFLMGRMLGPKSVERVGGVGEDVAWLGRLVDRFGPYAVMCSRPVPILAEVITCVAGYGGMRPWAFWAAAAAGTVPLCAVYAWWGAHQGSGQWLLPTLVGAVILPMIGWGMVALADRKVPSTPRSGPPDRG